MKQPCIDCGVVTTGTRCPQHAARHKQAAHQQQTRRRQLQGGRSKYGGTYGGAARAVRATATICWLCGTGPDPADPWQADHIEQGTRWGATGAVAPAHRSCNIRRRHLAGQGYAHDRIVSRLRILKAGLEPEGAGVAPIPPLGRAGGDAN